MSLLLILYELYYFLDRCCIDLCMILHRIIKLLFGNCEMFLLILKTIA